MPLSTRYESAETTSPSTLTPVIGIDATGPGRYTWQRGAHVQQPALPAPQTQLNHSPLKMYGCQVPSVQYQPEPQLPHSRPQGRTVRSHSPKRRPVAAHMTKAPYSAAACCSSGVRSSQKSFPQQALGSKVQLQGREGAGVVKTST